MQSREFSRPECWSGLPFPSPGDLLNPGIEPKSPTLQSDSLLLTSTAKCQKGEYLLTIHRVSKVSNKTEKTDVLVGVSCTVLVGKINLKT